MIDLTDLADDRAATGIDELCRRAAKHGVAAVCVWPEHVARCRQLLAEDGAAARVAVATVVNFPTGDRPVDEVLAETNTAIADGADEIDVVIPYRRLLVGDEHAVTALMVAVRSACDAAAAERGRTVHLKAICETGELGDVATMERAARLAVAAGADFVKTSTGKTSTGATLESAAALLRVAVAAPRSVGVKPSGGIKTAADATAYLALADDIGGAGWATPATFRFGASSLLDALLDAQRSDID